MVIKIDPVGSDPIYVQLRNQIVLGIGEGQLGLGQSLPTVRQMAADTGINMMTVNKAYTILKNEGFIEIDRRHGAKVNPNADRHGDYAVKMEEELKLLITESALKGIPKDQFLTLCNELYEKMKIQTYEEAAI